MIEEEYISDSIKELARQACGVFSEGDDSRDPLGRPTITFSYGELMRFSEFLLDTAADEILQITGTDYQTELFDHFEL